jgi:hypothetical protein
VIINISNGTVYQGIFESEKRMSGTMIDFNNHPGVWYATRGSGNSNSNQKSNEAVSVAGIGISKPFN